MKKRNIIILSITIAIAILIFVESVWHEPIVTGKVSEIVSMNIVFIDTHNNYQETTVELENTNDIALVFSLLKQDRTRTTRRPDHNQSIQLDYDAVLRITYIDNHIDEVYVTNHLTYRFLSTKGGSGDPGFVMAKNNEIYAVLLQWMPKKH